MNSAPELPHDPRCSIKDCNDPKNHGILVATDGWEFMCPMCSFNLANRFDAELGEAPDPGRCVAPDPTERPPGWQPKAGYSRK